LSDKKYASFVAVSLILVVISAGLSVATGSLHVSFFELLRGVVRFFGSSDGLSTGERVVRDLRMPRFFLGLFTGGALAASGAVFQTILNNPLADPYILGVSGGAAVGSVFAFVMFDGAWPILQFFSFLGALAGAFAVYFLAGVSGRRSPGRLILMGVIVGALMNAFILLLLAFVPPGRVPEALFWLMGDLSRSTPSTISFLFPVVSFSLVVLVACGRGLDVMLLGDEGALSTGLSVERFKTLMFVTVSLLTGVVVSFSGLIGFVGLIIPHVVRRFTGAIHRRVLIGSFLLGGSFLVLSDVISRSFRLAGSLPVGAVTAVFGAPFFIYILRRRM